MSKGLFNLEGFDAMGDDDILSVNINESGEEFGSKCPATNPTVTFDANATGSKETSVPVPGGDKETPTAKPAGGEVSITIPGGNGETPSAKPYDASSVSIPSKTTLTADQYNSAIGLLKKSFKEGAEIMEMLEGANIVTKTTIELQQEFTENALEDAMLSAYENGPIFEAVSRSDKDEVKAIVQKIRGSFPKAVKKISGVKFYPARSILRTLFVDAFALWSNRMWQILGVILLEGPNMKTVVEALTEEYKEDLGEYKILYSNVYPSLFDFFRGKFGWKNQKDCFFVIIDKRMPKELKDLQTEMADAAGDSKTATKEKEEVTAKK